MEINVDIQPDCTAALKVTIPAADTAKSRQGIVASYASRAKIPGFRPGKTPVSIIEKRFKKEIEEELFAALFDQACSTTLEQNPTLKVLNFGQPEQSIDENGNYTASTSLTIVPTFELPEYKGIEVSVPSSEITDEDVEKALTQLAEQIAEYDVVDREAAMGDAAVIDFKGMLDGKPIAEALETEIGFLEGREGQWMQVEEDQFLPGFASALAGMKADETKEITVEIPAEFPIAEVQGKTVTFVTTLKEVREKKVPALDEDFAAKVLPGKTLEEIKELMKQNLGQRKTQEIEEMKADQITEKLADLLSFELPEAVVSQEIYSILQRKLQQAMYNGQRPEDMDKFIEEAREESREEAKRNLKVFFMLQEVAQKEGISVNDQELFQEISRQANQAKKNIKSFIRELQRDGRVHGIRVSILTAKVLDFLTKEAKVTVEEK